MSESLYDFTVRTIDGKELALAEFRGKVALVVNTASECGFTGQYDGLQKLYEKYRDRKFTVLGFPSNDYRGQEPGSNEEIAKFCSLKFNVTFPMFEKNPVKGDKKQPVYKFLTERSDAKFQGDPGWNFVKLLVNKKGQVVNRFSAITRPASKKIAAAIERALAEPD